MEEQMVRRKDRPRLTVREAFETTRLGQQCLIAVDGGQLEPDDAYVDEGYSGSILVRPALERLRDAAAAGRIGQLYVLAPDRLARRHAHQALLMEEFRP